MILTIFIDITRFTTCINLTSKETKSCKGTGKEQEMKGAGIMRKGMALLFILMLGVPALSHAQSANDALRALRKLEAQTKTGLSYRDYGNALSEAKYPVDLFFKSKDVKKYQELSTSLQKTILHYEYVLHLWTEEVNAKNKWASIPINSEDGKRISRLYPDANKYALFTENAYNVADLIPIIFKEASRELDIATKLYADSQDDETRTLKKEIARLKKEVARLKKENDLLKKSKNLKKGN